MNQSLQARCRAFLGRRVPAEVPYVPDSISERIIQLVAQGVKLDAELVELLPICIADALAVAESTSGAERELLLESAALLGDIADEAS